MSDLEPIDPALRSLLDASKGTTAVPREARARIGARVARSIGAAGGAAPRGARHGAGSLVGSARRMAPWVATFLAGTVVGAAVVHATRTSPAPIVLYVDRPAPSETPAPARTPEADAGETADTTPTPAPTTAPAPVSSRGDYTSAERAMLDAARVALERGDGASALAATDKHARLFPNGALVQEREAIAVRALVLLGRRDEARARAARFVTRFPGSLLRPAVEAAVANP